jgi:cytochrome c oxidase cbb3-type subunit 1
MSTLASNKSMRVGEFGLLIFFAMTTLLCLIISVRTTEGAFAFHAALATIASLGAIFAIFNRYVERPAQTAPLEIEVAREN